METVTTYCQAGFQPYETCTQLPHTCTQTFPYTDYLLSGKATYRQAKLPTVRQSYLATYCQASKGPLSGKAHTVRHAPKSFRIHAPNNRIHAPNRSIDMHPNGIDLHPKEAAYMHPKGIDSAPKSSRIHASNLGVFQNLENL